jgi:hypothetical protein
VRELERDLLLEARRVVRLQGRLDEMTEALKGASERMFSAATELDEAILKSV